MSQEGPSQDFERLLNKFSQSELAKFRPILAAQQVDDDARVSELASKLTSSEKERYNEFVDIIELYNQQKDALEAKKAYHQSKIDAAKQRVDHHEREADRVVQQYTPAMEAAMSRSAASSAPTTSSNGHGQSHTNGKKKGSCTIL
ncbi:MAG: hypothetical protein JSR17_00010 [Proteobacteria bacterium]|nr:hypothetical protein [Pseudomonadota bacterium]